MLIKRSLNLRLSQRYENSCIHFSSPTGKKCVPGKKARIAKVVRLKFFRFSENHLQRIKARKAKNKRKKAKKMKNFVLNNAEKSFHFPKSKKFYFSLSFLVLFAAFSSPERKWLIWCRQRRGETHVVPLMLPGKRNIDELQKLFDFFFTMDSLDQVRAN